MGVARARRRQAVERGHLARRYPNSAEARTPVVPRESRTAGVQQDVTSGAAGGFIGRQPVTHGRHVNCYGNIDIDNQTRWDGR
jgi:hypothetical protein